MLWGVVREVQLRCDLPLLNTRFAVVEKCGWVVELPGRGRPGSQEQCEVVSVEEHDHLADSDGRGTRGEIEGRVTTPVQSHRHATRKAA